MVNKMAKRKFGIAVDIRGRKKLSLVKGRFTKKGALDRIVNIEIAQERGVRRIGGTNIGRIKKLHLVRVKK